MVVRMLLLLSTVAMIVAAKVAMATRRKGNGDFDLTDLAFEQIAVLGLALFFIVLIELIVRLLTQREAMDNLRPLILGAGFGVLAGVLVSIIVPPPELREADPSLRVLLYRYERIVLQAGFIGAGIYLVLQLIARSTSRVVASRFEEIAAMIVAFSFIFIGGLWVAMEIQRVGAAMDRLTLGLISWVGAGRCDSARFLADTCVLSRRTDIARIAAAMLASFFCIVAMWEARRWRLSLVRTIIVQGSVVAAGAVLFAVVATLLDDSSSTQPPSKWLQLGPFLIGLALYASLFSFWVTWSRHHSLVEALCDAFASTDNFRSMAEARLQRYFVLPPRAASLEAEVRSIVMQATRNGWLAGLVAAARRSRPTHLGLIRIAERLDVGIAPPPAEASAAPTETSRDGQRQPRSSSGVGLEKLIREQFNVLDPVAWRTRQAELENCVCCIVTRNKIGGGTGWLVAPDLVLTNYHVVEAMFGERPRVKVDDVECRFDFKETSGARYQTFRLAGPKPIVEWSPYHGSDEDVAETTALPTSEHLDFALLRLQEPAGLLPIGDEAEKGAPKRGWISLAGILEGPDVTLDIVRRKMQIYMLQHPYGGRLKHEWGPVTLVNANGTRIRHEATTDGGSSGSPCFDMSDLKPFALHHGGKESAGIKFNQAVPLKLILALIKARGRTEEFWQFAPGKPLSRGREQTGPNRQPAPVNS